MRYTEHALTLSRLPESDLATLKLRASQGNAFARARLQSPPYPRTLAYLDRWSKELLGRSGIGMSGFSPLSYQELSAWAQWTGNVPLPHEVEALMVLDAIRIAPPPRTDAPTKPADAPAVTAPWPSPTVS